LWCSCHKCSLRHGRTADSIENAKKVDSQLAIAGQQAKAAQDSVEATNRQISLEQRAWVAVNPIVTGPLYFNNEGVWIPIEIEMTNVGRSPAQYVKLWQKLVVSFAPPTNEEIESTCALLKKPPTSKETNGWVLFPNQTGRQPYPAFASTKDINASLVNSGIPGKIGFSLILCADYTMTFDSTIHHQTRQAYSVIWFDKSKGGIGMGAFDPQSTQPVPVSLILRIGGFTD
jgi:hypothetical protein